MKEPSRWTPEQLEEIQKLKEGATAALLRAARNARELARQTGTKIVVMRNGELVVETPAEEPEADGT